MEFAPDQCVFLMRFLTGTHGQEMPATRKVIAAIPEGNKRFQLDPKGMSAIQLGWHIVTSEEWFLKGILDGKFGMEENKMPEDATVESVLARYEANVPPLVDQVKAMSPADLARPVGFFGMMTASAAFYLGFMNNHSIHHRGQLAAMLRPAGSKVPSIYGGSADEPFQMPA